MTHTENVFLNKHQSFIKQCFLHLVFPVVTYSPPQYLRFGAVQGRRFREPIARVVQPQGRYWEPIAESGKDL